MPPLWLSRFARCAEYLAGLLARLVAVLLWPLVRPWL